MSARSHVVGRKGASAQKSKTVDIVQFPPLKEKAQVQQFLGYQLLTLLPAAPVRSLREGARRVRQRSKGVPTRRPIGPGETQGDLAVRSIKLMAR